MSRTKQLSREQIEQVARRVNAPEGQLIFFSRDGVILHTHAEQRGTLALHNEIYSARRESGRLEVERVSSVLSGNAAAPSGFTLG